MAGRAPPPAAERLIPAARSSRPRPPKAARGPNGCRAEWREAKPPAAAGASAGFDGQAAPAHADLHPAAMLLLIDPVAEGADGDEHNAAENRNRVSCHLLGPRSCACRKSATMISFKQTISSTEAGIHCEVFSSLGGKRPGCRGIPGLRGAVPGWQPCRPWTPCPHPRP